MSCLRLLWLLSVALLPLLLPLLLLLPLASTLQLGGWEGLGSNRTLRFFEDPCGLLVCSCRIRLDFLGGLRQGGVGGGSSRTRSGTDEWEPDKRWWWWWWFAEWCDDVEELGRSGGTWGIV